MCEVKANRKKKMIVKLLCHATVTLGESFKLLESTLFHMFPSAFEFTYTLHMLTLC